MSDRYCIASNGSKPVHLSAQEVTACDHEGDMGCNGGVPETVYTYWRLNGIVDGGNYNDTSSKRPAQHGAQYTQHGAKHAPRAPATLDATLDATLAPATPPPASARARFAWRVAGAAPRDHRTAWSRRSARDSVPRLTAAPLVRSPPRASVCSA